MSPPLPISAPDVIARYPARASERDAWVIEQRPKRNVLNPFRPYAFLMEEEPDSSGAVVPVATIFLTNRECPWRCVMCDLWQNTLADTTPAGAIPAQIDFALSRLGPASVIKLYNAGSFFDPHAIPSDEYPAIAEHVRGFDRVIVECHPALIGDAVLRFRDLLRNPQPGGSQLEVAIGLETAHPGVLERLNKRLTLDQFRAAADFLRSHSIALRVFILVQPPFMPADESFEWACRSLDFAFDCGATAATLIPTRGGNGAMEALAVSGDFSPPSLSTLGAAVAYGIGLQRGRVFADLWDLPRPIDCPQCRDDRISRLRGMNLLQSVASPITCNVCGGSA